MIMYQMRYFTSLLLTILSWAPRICHGGPFHFQENYSDKAQGKHKISSINYGLYHRSDLLLKMIEGIVHRHPDKMSIGYLTSNTKGYSAKIAVVTFATEQHQNEEHKLRVLLSFGQHGRELITSEVALRLLRVLAGEYQLSILGQGVLDDILQNVIIKVVPLENLNGRKLVEEGKLCERKNGRGVDINRNWGIDWGKKEKDYDPSEEFPGSGPFSEPETRIMRRIAHSYRPHMWVNVHSGMEALFMPYDHKNSTPNGVCARLMASMLKRLNSLYCKNACVVGPGGGSVGYLAHGTATDYMYDVVKVPVAFTFEIYGDSKASNDDCFRMFNPVDSAIFKVVVETWSAALLKFINFPNDLNLPVNSFEVYEASNIVNSSNQLSTTHQRKNIWPTEQQFIFRNEREIVWDTTQVRKLSVVLFILSTVLLILVYCKVSKHPRFQNVFLLYFSPFIKNKTLDSQR